MKTILHKLKLIAFILFFVLSGKAQIQYQKNNIVNDSFKVAEISNFVEIYSSKKLISPDILLKKIKNNELEHLPSNNYYPKMYNKFFWMVINIKNTSNTNKELILEIDYPQIDSLLFYEINNESLVTLISENGDQIPFYKRKVISELPSFPINIQEKSNKKFLLMLRKRSSIRFPAKIYDKKYFNLKNKNKLFIYGLYFGGMFITLVFSFLFGIFLKNKTILFYALYILSVGFYLALETGLAFEYIYPNTILLNSVLRGPINIIWIVFGVLFTFFFLEIKKNSKLLTMLYYIYFIYWGFYLLSLFIAEFIFKTSFLITILSQVFLRASSFLILLISLVAVFKKNKVNSIAYLFAVSFFIIATIIFYLPKFGLLQHPLITIHPFLIASIGEFTAFSIAIFFNVINVFEEKNKLIELNAKQEKDILTAQIEGSEKTKIRISNELHDNISSRLALIKNVILTGNKNKEDISEDITEIYKEVRELSHRLSPNKFFILGCSTSIKNYLKKINDNTNLKIKTEIYCDIDNSLDNEFGLQVFRIIQEALQNCIKHAGEADVKVQIILDGNELSLTIDDNGKGFNINDKTLMNGNGIKNIEMRTKLLNGTFDISSEVGGGTFINITIPAYKKYEIN